MIYTVTTQPKEIDFSPSLIDEILQNVRTILSTLQNTVPLFRRFGVDGSFLDDPMLIAEAKMAAEVIEKVQEFEPRAIIQEVKFDREQYDGQVRPIVYLRIKEGVL